MKTMNLYDIKLQYADLTKRLEIILPKFSSVNQKLDELEKVQAQPNFWNNQDQVTQTNKQKKALEKRQEKLNLCKKRIEDFNAGIDLAQEDETFITEQELLQLKTEAESVLQSLWIETLLSKDYDDGPAILTFHPGAGGEEAQDWAEMLARMYVRYANNSGFDVTVLDYQAGDGAGIKSQTILVEGSFAYGYLQTERGVHRLVRLSPYDANNRRHTSFASVEVSPFVSKKPEIEINEKDLKIDTYRSSGAGGQHVNKTESAIRITHLPTGIVVQCQNERSQMQNKEMAMNMLYSKLLEKQLAEEERQKQLKLSENKKIEWGSQIRSYVLHPYNLVKDHRTNLETSATTAVLDGDIQQFINEFLKVNN